MLYCFELDKFYPTYHCSDVLSHMFNKNCVVQKFVISVYVLASFLYPAVKENTNRKVFLYILASLAEITHKIILSLQQTGNSEGKHTERLSQSSCIFV